MVERANGEDYPHPHVLHDRRPVHDPDRRPVHDPDRHPVHDLDHRPVRDLDRRLGHDLGHHRVLGLLYHANPPHDRDLGRVHS
ncbi:MAG: hypothetical protein Q9186_005601 [Xanthomendoza sp. 1 TL-2023]